jgi:16S rRNA processing protein RimM
VGVFGLRGGIKVEPLTDVLERFAVGSTVYLEGKAYEVERMHLHKQQVRVRLSGIETVSEAEKCVGKFLEAQKEERPLLPEGEYWVDELLGMEVVEESGERLGTLDEVISAPAHDVYRVGSLLLPARGEFIRSIDPEARRITVRLLPGMKPEPALKPPRRRRHGRKASR